MADRLSRSDISYTDATEEVSCAHLGRVSTNLALSEIEKTEYTSLSVKKHGVTPASSLSLDEGSLKDVKEKYETTDIAHDCVTESGTVYEDTAADGSAVITGVNLEVVKERHDITLHRKDTRKSLMTRGSLNTLPGSLEWSPANMVPSITVTRWGSITVTVNLL